MSLLAAVIGDVVSSRQHPDQAAMLRNVRDATAAVNDQVDAVHHLRATIGDEFQGVYRTVADAVRAVWRLRLVLIGGPGDPIDVRSAIGWGEVTGPTGGTEFVQQSGTAWWRARDRLESVAASAKAGRPPSLRTAVGGLADEGRPDAEAAFNVALACVDELLARLDHRSATTLLMTLDGTRQAEIADRLGVSQPAVSSRLRADGLWTLVHAYRTLEGPA